MFLLGHSAGPGSVPPGRRRSSPLSWQGACSRRGSTGHRTRWLRAPGEPVDNASWAGNRMHRGTLARLGIPGKSRAVSQRRPDAKGALERIDRMSADAFFKKVRTYADLSEE